MRLSGSTQPNQGNRDRFFQCMALSEDTESCYLTEENADAAVAKVSSMLRRAHNLKWNNEYKEPLWRLVYNAQPTAARLHKDEPCGCCGKRLMSGCFMFRFHK